VALLLAGKYLGKFSPKFIDNQHAGRLPDQQSCPSVSADVSCGLMDGQYPLKEIVMRIAIALTSLVVVALMLACGSGLPTHAPDTNRLTMTKYNAVKVGMTYDQVVKAVGKPDEELSRSNMADIQTVMYAWKNSDGTNMHVTFQDGRVTLKAQFGLKD
jgi:Domain of Unknown Function with PDB structure (DUF3862)